MLKKFFKNSLLVQALTPDNRSGLERLAASPFATATTPDQIIVAHILQSVVTKPEEWSWRSGVLPFFDLNRNYTQESQLPRSARYEPTHTLVGPDISVSFYISCDGSRPGWWIKSQVTIIRPKSRTDPLALDTDAGNMLTMKVAELWKQLTEAEEAAAKAKAAMEINERKWNFAETLLGMKRNEHGALVPTDTPE